MQDKHNIDEQFMNQAWGDMEALLDKEMPVQQPKRRLAFWWFFGGIAASVALVFLYFNVAPLEKPSKGKIANNTTINAAAKPVLPTDITSQTEMEEQKRVMKSSTEIATTMSTETSLSTQNSKQKKTNVKALNKTLNLPNSTKKQTISEAFTARKTASAKTAFSKMKPNIQQETEERIILPNTTFFTRKSSLEVAFLPKKGLLFLPSKSNLELFIFDKKLDTKKEKWQHGVLLGWDYTSKSTSNIQLAYLAHFKLKKWRISSGVGGTFPLALSQSDLALSLDDSFADEIEIIEPEMDTSISTVDAMLDSNQVLSVNESRTNTVFIPLYVRYQKKRFSYFVGGQVAYTLHKSLTDLEIERINMDNNLATIEETKNWSYQLGAGLGYQVGKNWNIDLSYQHRLNKSGDAIQLGLHYYFD